MEFRQEVQIIKLSVWPFQGWFKTVVEMGISAFQEEFHGYCNQK